MLYFMVYELLKLISTEDTNCSSSFPSSSSSSSRTHDHKSGKQLTLPYVAACAVLEGAFVAPFTTSLDVVQTRIHTQDDVVLHVCGMCASRTRMRVRIRVRIRVHMWRRLGGGGTSRWCGKCISWYSVHDVVYGEGGHDARRLARILARSFGSCVVDRSVYGDYDDDV